jgi:hypothetical protein
MIYDIKQVFEAKSVKEYITEMQFLEYAKTAIILYLRLSKSLQVGEVMVFLIRHYGNLRILFLHFLLLFCIVF